MENQQQKDMCAIKQRLQECFDHYSAQDWPAMSTYFTQDSWGLLPGGPQTQGRQAVQDDYNRVHSLFKVGSIQMEVDAFQAVGPQMAIHTTRAVVQDADRQPIDYHKGLFIWKKVDDTWFIHMEIFNTSTK